MPAGPARSRRHLVVVLLLVVAASPLADAYGGWPLGAGRRWRACSAGWSRCWSRAGSAGAPGRTVLVAAGGTSCSARSCARPAASLPTPDAAARAGRPGCVRAWRDIADPVPLLGSDGIVLVVPLVIGLVGGRADRHGCCGARRRPGPGVPGPWPLVLAVAAAFGDRVSPHDGGARVGWRSGCWLWLRACGARPCAISVGAPGRLCAAPCWAAVGGAPAPTWPPARTSPARAAARPSTPPFDPLDYPSPLSRYRAFTTRTWPTPDAVHRDRPCRPRPRAAGDHGPLRRDRVERCGWRRRARAPRAGSGACAADGDRAGRHDHVRIEDYTGVWVPTLGVTESATGADGRGARRRGRQRDRHARPGRRRDLGRDVPPRRRTTDAAERTRRSRPRATGPPASCRPPPYPRC